MEWYTLLSLLVGSSALTTLVGGLINRGLTRAQALKGKNEGTKIYTDSLEHRLDVLSRRQDRYEWRDAIQQSAINCAHKCGLPDDDCPVLCYINQHPVPPITEPSYSERMSHGDNQ